MAMEMKLQHRFSDSGFKEKFWDQRVHVVIELVLC